MAPTLGAQWVVLGAGTILSRPGLGPAGHGLLAGAGEPWVLFDCGPGTLRSLANLGVGPERVGAVVLSHYHPDHCLDLFALLFARRNPSLAGLAPLELVGPKGLQTLLEGGRQAFGRWVEDPGLRVREFRADGDGLWRGQVGTEGASLSLIAAENGHAPHAVSYRVELPSGLAVGYTGDTGPNPRLAELFRGVDLLVAESSYPDAAPSEHHLTPSEGAELARASGARRLLLTHFYPGLEGEDAAQCARARGVVAMAARDGLRVPL